MDGERCRVVDEGEVGVGESSGAGGGGRINWKVRVAICIVDLLKQTSESESSASNISHVTPAFFDFLLLSRVFEENHER